MLKIHGVPVSIHTRKVVVAALEKKIDYQLEVVFPFEPPAGWKELSPTGKIPAITDGDFHVADSSVILAYLERKHPDRPLYPADLRQFARALWFEEYIDGGIAPHIIAIFHQRIFNPMLHQKASDETIVAEMAGNQLPPRFDYLEESLLGDFLVGDSLSVADITLASNLMIYHYLGFTLDGKRHPGLAAHFARMLRRPSFQASIRSEQGAAARLGLDAGFLRTVAG